MITTNSLNEARKQIQKLKKNKELVVVLAQSPEFNRKILENPDVDILLNPEIHERKDRLKQRDSGLNEYLCRLARKNKIKIGIDLGEVINKPKPEKAKILSRILQNIKLCRRTKTPIIIYPDKYKKQDIMALFLSLKASTQQAKKSCIS